MNDPEHLLPANPNQPVILVVDDEVMIVNIARIALEGDGYFVLTAQNGQEALEISRKFPGSIHLLVSDVVMPKMDGMKLREQMTAERPATKVLLMSGTVDAPVVSCPFLRKPFEIGALRTRVRQLLAFESVSGAER
jgi:two-component system, cell cycle sensor histidine kinase and response regulator CckA